jgi:dUTP pyrophosphatase
MKFEKCSVTSLSGVEYDKLDDKFDLPTRSTSGSAGYDFHSPFDLVIKKRKTVKFPLLVKAVDMPKDMVLLITNRSGLSLKWGVTIDNAIGVIDSDYEKCIWIQLTNHGRRAYRIKANDKVAQGIFVRYGTVDGDTASGLRNGGFGSTGR